MDPLSFFYIHFQMHFSHAQVTPDRVSTVSHALRSSKTVKTLRRRLYHKLELEDLDGIVDLELRVEPWQKLENEVSVLKGLDALRSDLSSTGTPFQLRLFKSADGGNRILRRSGNWYTGQFTADDDQVLDAEDMCEEYHIGPGTQITAAVVGSVLPVDAGLIVNGKLICPLMAILAHQSSHASCNPRREADT